MSGMKIETSLQILQTFKKMIRNNYNRLYAYDFDNLDEMDKFLESHKLTKLLQEEVDNLNSPIPIEFVV